MPEPITTAHCAAACDRLALKLDQALALLEARPPVDQAEVDQMHAAAEAALSTWRAPIGWWW
jgi:hypothetical protein